MLNSNYLCTLDIGSSKISACLARLKRNHLENIFFDSLPSRGVKEGVIVDAVELTGLIGKLLKDLKSKSGMRIKFVHTNFSGKDILTKHSHAVIPLAERGNKVVTSTDINLANEQARILASNLEDEIIHVIPSSYSIDAKSNVINPLGLYSHKLEVDLYLICARLSSLQTLSRVINQAGYEMRNLSFSGLATSKIVLGKEHKRGVTLVCDIGSDITEILLFRDGLLQNIQILPLGGGLISARISSQLQVNLELAEDIKRSCGIIVDTESIVEDREVLVKKDQFYQPIKQRQAMEIATIAARSICESIKVKAQEMAPLYEINNFIMAGKTMLTDGFIETAENILGLPVKLGRINNEQINALIKENNELSGQKYLTYLTALGMICEDLELKSTSSLPLAKPAKNLALKAINRFKEVYQEYF